MKKLLLLLLFSTASFSQINLQPPPPYVICEHPYDGYATFILSSHNSNILGNLNPQLYNIKYFSSMSAETADTPLPDLFVNQVPNEQIIIGKLTEIATGNYELYNLLLRVEAAPPTIAFQQQFLCQDPVSGAVEPIELNTGLNASLYTFQWMKGNNVLPDTSNTLTVTEPGYYTVQVTANTATGCTTSSSVPIMLSGMATVNLSINTDDVTVNATGPGDYEYRIDNGPYQDSPSFTDIPIGDHGLYVIDMNGCGIVVVPFAIISNFAHSFNEPNDLYGCTANGGIPATFDLTVNDAVILNGLSPNLYTVSYHNTDNPAVDPVSGLINNPQQYTAINTNQGLRAMVVENANPSHKAVYDFMLVSGLQPLPGTVAPININDNNYDGQAIVDLTTTQAQILNGQSAVILSITYHTSQPDAENGTNPIALPTAFYSSTQTIYFRVTYFGFCNATGSFQINVLPTMTAEDNILNTMKYFPNPAKDVFTIESNDVIDKIEIYNLTGQLVKSRRVDAETASLNIADLQNGIYMVKIGSALTKTIKMVKQ